MSPSFFYSPDGPKPLPDMLPSFTPFDPTGWTEQLDGDRVVLSHPCYAEITADFKMFDRSRSLHLHVGHRVFGCLPNAASPLNALLKACGDNSLRDQTAWQDFWTQWLVYHHAVDGVWKYDGTTFSLGPQQLVPEASLCMAYATAMASYLYPDGAPLFLVHALYRPVSIHVSNHTRLHTQHAGPPRPPLSCMPPL